MDGQTSLLEWKWWSRGDGDAAERRYDDEARCGIISVRDEGADMPTGKTKSRCAWGAVNASAVAVATETEI